MPQKREYLFPVLSLPWFPAWAGGTARTAGCICSCICTAQPLLQPQTPQQQDKGVSHPRAVLSVLQSQKPGAGIATELWNHSSGTERKCHSICSSWAPPGLSAECGLLSVLCKPQSNGFSQASIPLTAGNSSDIHRNTAQEQSPCGKQGCVSHSCYSSHLKGK